MAHGTRAPPLSVHVVKIIEIQGANTGLGSSRAERRFWSDNENQNRCRRTHFLS